MDEEIKCVTSSKLAAIYQQTDVIDYLHTIKSGTIYSWRHNVFYKLPDTENNLKSSDLGHYFYCGGFTDSRLEELEELLTDDQNLKECSGEYKFKVLMPEVLVKITEIICVCHRELAERYLMEGAKIDPRKIFFKSKGKKYD